MKTNIRYGIFFSNAKFRMNGIVIITITRYKNESCLIVIFNTHFYSVKN